MSLSESATGRNKRRFFRPTVALGILFSAIVGAFLAAALETSRPEWFSGHRLEAIGVSLLLGAVFVVLCYEGRILSFLTRTSIRILDAVSSGISRVIGYTLLIALGIMLVWLLVSGIHWLWTHPLF
jgi:hypothetical protein